MREIKFRVWDIDKKKWFEKPKSILDWTYNDLTIYGDSLVWLQYTGLKDKNGKEIYEGDILDWGGQMVKTIYRGCVFGFVGIERFANGRAEYSFDTITNPEITTIRDAKIIGNIYENPELLK